MLKFEAHLIRHVCRAKKRFLDRDRQHVRFAYVAYRMFYETHYRNRKTVPNEEHFEASNVYDAFVRFGQYMIDVNAISPEEFTRFAIASKTPVDRWCSDKLYMEYVRALNKNEDGERALFRNANLMLSWAMQQEGRHTSNFFREISPGLAVQWLMSGRISPWVIFNCETGQALINRLTPEQFGLLEKAIDIPFWQKNFRLRKDEVEYVQDFLKGEGM